MGDIVLSLKNVSRMFPRNTANIPSALLREMLLPRRQIHVDGADSFYALDNVNISLENKQKLGVIGTHLSGKTILANIASGLLDPTSGHVHALGTRLLVSRPTAGFKPSLTIRENLGFRASLMGIYGQKLEEMLDETLARCGVSEALVRQPIGNVSPYIVKQLAFTLLLTFEADIIVVDELTSAGASSIRKNTRLQLQGKIENCSSLIISSDPSFLQELTKLCFILAAGKLSGPYNTEEAIERYGKLEHGGANPRAANGGRRSSVKRTKYSGKGKNATSVANDVVLGISSTACVEERQYQHDESAKMRSQSGGSPRKVKIDVGDGKLYRTSPRSTIFSISSLNVDGDAKYSHRRYSLLRSNGDSVYVEIVLLGNQNVAIQGGVIELFESSAGAIVARSELNELPRNIAAGKEYKFTFTFQALNDRGGVFGLAFTPLNKSNKLVKKSRLKILMMGIGNTREKNFKEIPILDFEFKEIYR